MAVFECLLLILNVFLHFWILLIWIFLFCIFLMSNISLEYIISYGCLSLSSIYHLLWMFLFHKILLDISSQYFEWLFLSSFEWSPFGMILFLNIYILQFWIFNWILFSHKNFSEWLDRVVFLTDSPSFTHFWILSNTFP